MSEVIELKAVVEVSRSNSAPFKTAIKQTSLKGGFIRNERMEFTGDERLELALIEAKALAEANPKDAYRVVEIQVTEHLYIEPSEEDEGE